MWRLFCPFFESPLLSYVKALFLSHRGRFCPLKRVFFLPYVETFSLLLRTLLPDNLREHFSTLLKGPFSILQKPQRSGFLFCAKPLFAIVCWVSPPLFFAGAFSTRCAWFSAWFWALWNLVSLFLMQGLYFSQNIQGQSNILQRWTVLKLKEWTLNFIY